MIIKYRDVLLLCLFILLGCNGKVEVHKNSYSKMEVKNKKQKSNATYSLIQIMHDLAFQMDRIHLGLMTNNRYMIKEGAEAIANHPSPKGGIKPYLKKNTGQIKSIIPEMDKNIHKTAIKMSQENGSLSMEELHGMYNTISKSCMACHSLFRDKE